MLLAQQNPPAAGLAAGDVPGAPSNLVSQVSGSTVVLTWTAPVAGAAPTSYLVEAGSVAAASDLARFDTGGIATSLSVTGVPDGMYFVRVRARNALGASGSSNEVVVIVGRGGPCPSPPAPTGLTSSVMDGETITISWNAVPGAITYVLEAGTAPGASNVGTVETASADTYYRVPMINGELWIRVRVRTGCGLSAASTDHYIAAFPQPVPPASITGRWLGISPGGLVADPGQNGCPIEWDLEMNLTQSGTAVSGTATTRNTKVQFESCQDVFRFVAHYGVSGTVGADGAISLAFGSTGSPAFTLTGSVSGGTMSGRYGGANGRGRFSVVRQ